MARTVAEIKKTMTDAFLADETLREKYGLISSDTWSGSFSSVSLENIIFFIVAAATHVLELIFDQYLSDVSNKISDAVVASVPWYHSIALKYQKGDALVFNENTMQYIYENIDESKQIVKYAAVRDKGTSVQILVSGDNNGIPEALSNDDLTVFKNYMNRVKIAGVILNITSKESDKLLINATIYIDPLILDNTGTSIANGNKPVEDAITLFLKSIIYGGIFNKTKLVDAIQAVEGVSDIELGECQYQKEGETTWTTIPGNNYSGASGSYIPSGLSTSLIYVVSD
jgi:hypothetical protein